MIRLELVHGSPEWDMARLGIPTASAFDQLLTPKTLEISKSSGKYRNKLLAEWLLGHPIDWDNQSSFMERGTAMEPEARACYEFLCNVEAVPNGFILRDDRKVGGSPDSLVGEDGGLEIKCPAINTHIGYLLDPASLVSEYRSQVQGYLYLTGREWWDIMAYSPALPPVIERVYPDPRYQAALEGALKFFIADLDEAKERLAAHRKEPEQIASAA